MVKKNEKKYTLREMFDRLRKATSNSKSSKKRFTGRRRRGFNRIVKSKKALRKRVRIWAQRRRRNAILHKNYMAMRRELYDKRCCIQGSSTIAALCRRYWRIKSRRGFVGTVSPVYYWSAQLYNHFIGERPVKYIYNFRAPYTTVHEANCLMYSFAGFIEKCLDDRFPGLLQQFVNVFHSILPVEYDVYLSAIVNDVFEAKTQTQTPVGTPPDPRNTNLEALVVYGSPIYPLSNLSQVETIIDNVLTPTPRSTFDVSTMLMSPPQTPARLPPIPEDFEEDEDEPTALVSEVVPTDILSTVRTELSREGITYVPETPLDVAQASANNSLVPSTNESSIQIFKRSRPSIPRIFSDSPRRQRLRYSAPTGYDSEEGYDRLTYPSQDALYRQLLDK